MSKSSNSCSYLPNSTFQLHPNQLFKYVIWYRPAMYIQNFLSKKWHKFLRLICINSILTFPLSAYTLFEYQLIPRIFEWFLALGQIVLTESHGVLKNIWTLTLYPHENIPFLWSPQYIAQIHLNIILYFLVSQKLQKNRKYDIKNMECTCCQKKDLRKNPLGQVSLPFDI